MFTVQKVLNFEAPKTSNVCDLQNNIILDARTKHSVAPRRVWVIPGHIFYSWNDCKSLVSYATYENFLQTSTNLEPFVVNFQHPVIELCTPILTNDNVILIVTQNGEVHVWRFDTHELEWSKQFTFKLGSGNNDSNLQTATFHEQLEFAVWCEKHGSELFEHSIYVRRYRSNAPNSMSDFCLNDFVSESILTHCPLVEFCTLGSLVTMRLFMQNSPNMFMAWSKQSGLSMLDTNGTVLWTDNPSPYKRFAKILACTLNSWINNINNPIVAHVANKIQEKLYVLTENGTLLSFNTTSNLCAKTSLEIGQALSHVLGFYVYGNFVCLFTNSEMITFDSKSGKCLESLSLTKQSPLEKTWFNSTKVSVYGIYNSNSVYRVIPKDYPSIFSSLNQNLVSSLNDANVDFIFKIKRVIDGKQAPDLDVARSDNPSLQSKALVLALLHHCSQLSLPGQENLNKQVIEHLVKTLPEAHNLKLKKLFRPLVESFLKLHSYSKQQL